MSIDWSATGDMLSGVGTLMGAIAVCVAGWLGRDVIANFSQQKIAERQIEYAEKILATAYRLKSALDQIRSPMILDWELEKSKINLLKDKKLIGLTEKEIDKFVSGNVYYIRLDQFASKFSEAYDILPFATVHFGNEVKTAVETLIRSKNSIMNYAADYAKDEGYDKNYSKEIKLALWKGFTTDPSKDKITQDVEAAVKTLEDKLFPVITPSKAPKNKFKCAGKQDA